MASPARATAQRLAEAIRDDVDRAGFVLEDLTVAAAGRRSVVRVVVDRADPAAGGITLDDVADASRVLSDALDRVDEADPGLLGGTYVLEVSSPGVDRPLTEPRHWARNVRRLVTAVPREGEPVTGRVVSAGESSVVLDVDGSERELAYADVVRGTVQVEFNRADPEEEDG